MSELFDYQSRYDFICRATAKDNDNQSLSAKLNTDLKQLEGFIYEDLTALARQGSPDTFADILQKLEFELIRFREFCEFPDLSQKVIVGIGGKFSAGKSTIINAILGKKQLVTEIDPTTSLPTYLLYGNTASVTALNLFNKKVALSMDEFQSLTHEEKSKYGSQIGSLLSSAFISDPDFRWQNIALMDTPGYTKPEEHSHSERTDENVARSQLNASQFIIWLVSAEDGTIKEDDLNFLASLNSDIPRLILVNKADKKMPEDIINIVALVKKTLTDRNVPVLDVIPVSRKKSLYPFESVTDWLDKWDKSPREISFGKNFKRQFRLYEQYIDAEERKYQLQLNRLNRILMVSDDSDVNRDAGELQEDVKADLADLQQLKRSLNDIQQLFFDKLKNIGDEVGITIPELGALEDMDFSNVKILDLLVELRESQGKKLVDYSRIFKDLTKQMPVRNLDLLLRRSSKSYFASLEDLSTQADTDSVAKLLRRESVPNLFA
ncbi:hypothetical protein SKB0120_05490 [Moraxella osloensis]